MAIFLKLSVVGGNVDNALCELAAILLGLKATPFDRV